MPFSASSISTRFRSETNDRDSPASRVFTQSADGAPRDEASPVDSHVNIFAPPTPFFPNVGKGTLPVLRPQPQKLMHRRERFADYIRAMDAINLAPRCRYSG